MSEHIKQQEDDVIEGSNDVGATIAEYGVAVAFVAILAGAGVLIFGETIGDWFGSLVDTLGI